MKKPSKEVIISVIQSILVAYTMVMGFWLEYTWIWWKTSLPFEWWSAAITMVLALLSFGGLLHWIRKENDKENDNVMP